MNNFKVGSLLYDREKKIVLRVIASGEQFVQVIEYTKLDSLDRNEIQPKFYSLLDGVWYKWTSNGGIPVKLTKCCTILPTKVPEQVRDFLSMESESYIIIGTPYKKVDSTNLQLPADQPNGKYIFLKGKTEAILNIKASKRESLHDRSSTAELITPSGTIKLNESDIWMIRFGAGENSQSIGDYE